MIADLYRLSVHGRQEGQDVINVMYYEVSAVGTPADSIVNLVDAWRARIEVQWLAVHASNYTLIGLNARKKVLPITQQLPPPAAAVPWPDTEAYDYAYVSPVAGTVAGTALPLSVSMVYQLRSLFAGRSGRGRIFMGAVPVSFTNLSAVATILPAPVSSLMALLPTAIYTVAGTGSQYKLQVVSRRLPGSFDVSFVGLNPYLRSQRRREIGVGS